MEEVFFEKYLKKVYSIAKIKIGKRVVEFIRSMLGGRKKMRKTEEVKMKIEEKAKTKNAETLAAVHTHTHNCFKE